MTWICYTDCRDGHRHAVPASYATLSWDRDLINGGAAYAHRKARDAAGMQAELLEEGNPMVAMLGTLARDAKASADEYAKAISKAEALVDGLPARDIIYTGAFQVVVAYTRDGREALDRGSLRMEWSAP